MNKRQDRLLETQINVLNYHDTSLINLFTATSFGSNCDQAETCSGEQTDKT
jgi:hypothetical protein